jgi:site-specific DNA-methyltransferase (adenine-specific)
MRDIPDESIDCVIVDPPYGTVKGMSLQNQPKDIYEWDNVLDMKKLFEEYFRIMKPKGKLFIFSQNKFTQEVRNLSSTYLKYLYPLIWEKDRYANYLSINKAPVQIFEDISVFEKIYGAMPRSRDYADKVLEFIGLTSNEINKQLGHRKTEHFFRTNTLQFSNVSREGYNDLIETYQINQMEGFLSHDEWLDLYNGERKEGNAKIAFNIPEGQKHFSNILKHSKDYPSLHPTQKPIALIEEIIKVYTEEQAVILDNCIGSGTTAIAALNTGRFFIGIEKEKEYVDIANKRIEEHKEQFALPV